MKRRVLLASLPALGVLALVVPALLAQEGGGAAKGKEAEEPEAALWNQPGQCDACHVETSWSKLKPAAKSEFDHATTGFPLRGTHAQADCDDCHRRGLAGLSQACHSCHADPHVGFNSLNCEQCHTEVDWVVPRNFFDHERTRFPLMGVHASLSCEACHRNFRTEPPATAPSECIVCHARDFADAAARSGFDHQQGPPFGPDCARCHDNVLPPITFDGATIK